MNNKKLFKGALVLFASILMAVSCSSNSKLEGDGSQKPSGDGTKQETVTIDKAAFLKALQGLGEVGEGTASNSDKYNFASITKIESGVTTPAELDGTVSSGTVSKDKTKAKLDTAFKTLNNVEGLKVTADLSGFSSVSGENAVSISLTIEAAEETTAKKYVLSEDLTTALTKGKLVIKVKPKSGVNWA